MKVVGIRDLKNRLSEYVRQAQAGEGVLVTDRGEVVAELGPPGPQAGGALPAGLAALARKGMLTPGEPNTPAVYKALPRVLKRRRAADLLDQERGPR